MRTLIHLLAIAGLGLILGTGHALVRTAIFGTPAVTLSDAPADASDDPPTPAVDTGNTDGVDGGVDHSDTPLSEPPTDPPAGDSLLDEPVNPDQITLREAHDLFEQGVWFLDARNESDFNAGHIEGAVWMPASHASTRDGQKALDRIPEGEIVVIYCTGGDCDASDNTKRRLGLLQYNFDVRIMGKGYIDWVEAGLPVTLPDDTGSDGGTP